jgi:hypothetical protein
MATDPQAIRMIQAIRKKAEEIKEEYKGVYGPDNVNVRLATLIELLSESVLNLQDVEA